MPRSKKRKQHHEFHPHAYSANEKKKRSAVTATMVFFTLVGTGIAFFAAGADPVWLLLGALAGAGAGYFFGRQVDKSFSK